MCSKKDEKKGHQERRMQPAASIEGPQAASRAVHSAAAADIEIDIDIDIEMCVIDPHCTPLAPCSSASSCLAWFFCFLFAAFCDSSTAFHIPHGESFGFGGYDNRVTSAL